MDLEQKQVGPDEVVPIYALLQVCGQDMKVRLGLNHWDQPFPLELLSKDAQERRTYTVYEGEQLVATYTIGDQAPSYYQTSPGLAEAWDTSGEPALYVNRLAVFPELQGQGIGMWCMGVIEQIAFDEGYRAIRLDAYEKNLSLVTWYKCLHYHVRGSFPLTRSFGAASVICMEKMRKDFSRP